MYSMRYRGVMGRLVQSTYHLARGGRGRAELCRLDLTDVKPPPTPYVMSKAYSRTLLVASIAALFFFFFASNISSTVLRYGLYYQSCKLHCGIVPTCT